jgi:hypothetical protein
LRRWLRVLGIDRLVRRGWDLLWLRRGLAVAEQAAEESCGVSGLLVLLLGLLLQLRDLCPGLVESDVLHKDGLSQHVKRIGIAGEFLIQQGFGIWVFLLKLG